MTCRSRLTGLVRRMGASLTAMSDEGGEAVSRATLPRTLSRDRQALIALTLRASIVPVVGAVTRVRSQREVYRRSMTAKVSSSPVTGAPAKYRAQVFMVGHNAHSKFIERDSIKAPEKKSANTQCASRVLTNDRARLGIGWRDLCI